MLLFNSRKMGGWVGGASVTWHVFQSALSLQASHGLERRPAAPAGQPPSLTPPTTPSTSSLALLPTYRAAPSLFGSIFGLGCLSAGGGRHSTDSLVRRHRHRLTLTNHLRLDQQQCQREDFCMFSKTLKDFCSLLFSFIACNLPLQQYSVAFLRPVWQVESVPVQEGSGTGGSGSGGGVGPPPPPCLGFPPGTPTTTHHLLPPLSPLLRGTQSPWKGFTMRTGAALRSLGKLWTEVALG